jgi:hypothetical protein
MFTRLEKELKNKGEFELAKDVRSLLERRGKDIPTGETIFTSKQKEMLEQKGYVIYELTGQSIASLRDSGHMFWSNWHKGLPFEHITSLKTEVAVDPKEIFLKKSNFHTLEEQLRMVEDFNTQIGMEIPGTIAIIGSAADYADLTFAHYELTGCWLFEQNHEKESFTRTTTPIGESDGALVGDFSAFGLGIASRPQEDNEYLQFGVAPLIIPASANPPVPGR